MRLTDIAIRSLIKRRAKMLFLLLGIVAGTATIVALSAVTTAMRQQVRAQTEETGVRVTVAPYTETLSLAYNGVTVATAVSYQTRELSPGALAAMGDPSLQANIRVTAPKLLAATEVENRRYLAVGVDFPAELRLNRHWQVEGRVPAGAGEALLGHSAAVRLGKKPGDSFEIGGASLRVAGVLGETGSQEDPLIFLDLGQTQALFRREGAVNFVELAVSRPALEQVLTQLKDRLPGTMVTAAKDQNEARREVADRFARFSFLITLVVLGVGILIISTAMMSSVNERTREIGVFRAIGFRQRHIMRIILTEAALVNAAGGILGYLLGMGLAQLAVSLVSGSGGGAAWNPLLGMGVVALSVLVGLGASLYPATKAAGLNPAEALRSI